MKLFAAGTEEEVIDEEGKEVSEKSKCEPCKHGVEE